MVDYLARYLLERDVGALYAGTLRTTIRHFERWLGRKPDLNDLSDDAANRWLVWLAEQGYGRRTIAHQRVNLLVLWRAAWMAELVPLPPRRVRRVAVPRNLPQAWQLSELQALLAAAANLPGRFKRSRVNRAAWFRALLLAAWDTGLRLGDLERLRLSDVGSDGAVLLCQRKTGEPLLCRVRAETVAAVEATYPPARERIFGGVVGRRCLFAWLRRIVRSAGVSGGMRKMRRSSGSWVEAIAPGFGAAHLGHAPGSATAARYYFDPRITQAKRPLPPPLCS